MKINKRTGRSGTVSQISLDNQKWSKGFELVFQSANKLPIVQSYVSIPQSLDLNWWIPRLVFMATLKIIFVNCDFATIQPYSYFIGVLLYSFLNWRHSTHEWLKGLEGLHKQKNWNCWWQELQNLRINGSSSVLISLFLKTMIQKAARSLFLKMKSNLEVDQVPPELDWW